MFIRYLQTHNRPATFIHPEVDKFIKELLGQRVIRLKQGHARPSAPPMRRKLKGWERQWLTHNVITPHLSS